MTMRFLAAVALVAGGATYLARRYRKQLESAATEIAAEAAATPELDGSPAPELSSSRPSRAKGDGPADPGEAVYVS